MKQTLKDDRQSARSAWQRRARSCRILDGCEYVWTKHRHRNAREARHVAKPLSRNLIPLRYGAGSNAQRFSKPGKAPAFGFDPVV